MGEIDPTLFRAMLLAQRRTRMKGGIYHANQVEFAYHSNRIEGSRLTLDQVRMIYDTKSVDGMARVDDVIEAANHFRAFDFLLDHLDDPLGLDKICEYHRLLKTGTSDAAQEWFAVGDWKRLPNEVGGHATTTPDEVDAAMAALVASAPDGHPGDIEQIAAFHHGFEAIHPFQDGNGRVGRLVMFEQGLVAGITPVIVLDDMLAFYYRGLSLFGDEPGWLTDTLRSAQDRYEARYAPMVHTAPDANRPR